MYDAKIVELQHKWFGPFPPSYRDIASDQQELAILTIMAEVPLEKMKPFHYLKEREICAEDKAFVLKIMKLDPRDRPTA